MNVDTNTSDYEPLLTENAELNVLFVDDEPQILSSLRRLFRRETYALFFASSGAEALEIMQQQEIDVIVSDMRMPNMDGAEFLSAAREMQPDTMRILLSGQSDFQSIIKALNNGGISRFVSKPWDDDGLKNIVYDALRLKRLQIEKLRLLEITRNQNEMLFQMNHSLEEKVKARTSELQQTADMLDESYRELKESYKNFVKLFSNIINQNPGTKEGFSQKVAELSEILADSMDLPESEIEIIEQAGHLHELGKLVLPYHCLDKPYTELNQKERYEFSRYPIYGHAALISVDYLGDQANIILHHRETWNGKGYPDKLVGEQIPIGSRILAVAADFFMLTEGLMVKRLVSEKDAIDRIHKLSGINYDPNVVLLLEEAIQRVSHRAAANEIRMVLADLKEGMVLSREVRSSRGIVLITRGSTLSARMIQKLRAMKSSDQTLESFYVIANNKAANSF
ncbi:HD domain-containing phosphohydrolase [Gynuella sp.]|uniref:HD domain-containing phosphohydrolase n=1 Tax=Gynuella sp. TaxID=2969146 RepID=UPI003D1178C1